MTSMGAAHKLRTIDCKKKMNNCTFAGWITLGYLEAVGLRSVDIELFPPITMCNDHHANIVYNFVFVLKLYMFAHAINQLNLYRGGGEIGVQRHAEQIYVDTYIYKQWPSNHKKRWKPIVSYESMLLLSNWKCVGGPNMYSSILYILYIWKKFNILFSKLNQFICWLKGAHKKDCVHKKNIHIIKIMSTHTNNCSHRKTIGHIKKIM